MNMAHHRVFCLVAMACLLAGTAPAQEEALTLYVAPNGNDAWSGRAAEPDPSGADGPFATLAGARDALRALKAGGGLSGPVRVQVRGGEYAITEPVVFGPADSGAPGAPIVYEAYPGEEPVIHGGRRLTGWQREDELWVVDLPEVREGGWQFGSLWVDGQRRQPARTPNAAHPWGDEPEPGDTFSTEGPVNETDPATGKEAKSATKVRYREGDLKPWPDLSDAIVVVYHSWATSLLRVKNLDEANRIVEFTGPARWHFGYWQPDQRYYVEGIREALDAPGEWYLDRQAGRLYYFPMDDEDPNAAEVIAPVARQLLVLEGKPAEGQFVRNLEFRGLRFRYTDWLPGPEGHSDGQAASSVNAAVETTGARDCVIADCEISRLGNYGVWFRAGSKNNRLMRCEITDLGAGGVRIGEIRSPASENEAAERNAVDNCYIHEGGRILREAVGAWIGRSSYNRLSHNEICDFRYTGISVGWSWGYDPSSAHHNTIEYNHVHHIGRGQLNDMGGIYTLGISPGTVIRHNVFHDIMSHPRLYGGWGIYFDEGSTDILAENNLVYNTRTGGFHQHYGRENKVFNNIFAYSHTGQLIRSREEEHISFIFERNIVYYNNGSLLGSTWKNGNWRMDYNTYWDTSGEPVDFQGLTLEEWREKGFDQHSIAADPLFVAPEAADFRLKPESPAIALGFKPFDTKDVGLYGDPAWVAKPKAVAREPFAPPALPEPKNLAEDFELTAVGAVAVGMHTLGEQGDASIRVTDETAANGSRSLKLVDAAGLDHAYNPHLVFNPGFRKGKAVAAFAVRPGAGAQLLHEWRDSRSPYRVGPSVWIQPDGAVTIGGREVARIPLDEWSVLRVECALGKDADGTFDLEVTLPGQAPQRIEDLPCGSAEFRSLEWLGFVMNADAAAVAYLDDVVCRVE
jgi:hypothetical protein